MIVIARNSNLLGKITSLIIPAVLLFVYITDSAKAVITDVQITPDEPTTEDIITVVTFGTEGQGPVTVIDTVVNITDPEIGLDITLTKGPLLVVTDWSYSVDIGRLSAGTHDLTVRTIVNSVLTDTYFKTFQVVPAPPMTLDGSGTQQDPWLIQSLDDFNEFAAIKYYWDDYTRLETNVNLAGMVYERAVIAWDVNDGESGFQGTAFTGVFDGNDHKIIGLTIDGGGYYLGLFGFINEGQVRNLGIEGGSVSGDWYVGGLVGWNDYGIVSYCYSTGDVRGQEWVGGLVGANRGSIYNSYATGDVIGGQRVGGLVGYNGFNLGDISYCYSTGDVNGVDYVGGLVGVNEGIIMNCNCFWDIDTQTHGVTDSIGRDRGIAINIYGKTTAEMKSQSTFTDWDFINVWNIGENQTYPHLRTYLTADLNKDGIVNFLDIAITANQWMEGDIKDE
ncbi:MAG: GLUG motif-containing protein [Planctomycetota bacterium]|jgi:hypothetical protein